MKISKLPSGKVRVTLSRPELSRMDINIDSLLPGSPTLSLLLFGILETVQRKTGFSPKSDVVVEATKWEDGITFVLSGADDIALLPETKPQKKNPCVVFEFESFADICSLIKNVAPVYLLSMHLYSCDGSFYLSVPRHKIPVLIYEYSFKNKKSPILESYLLEYGKLLAGGLKILAMSASLKKMN